MTTAYPPAFRADLQEIINGYLVADPYRWLEDPASEQTLDWLTSQGRTRRAGSEPLGVPVLGNARLRGVPYRPQAVRSACQDKPALSASR